MLALPSPPPERWSLLSERVVLPCGAVRRAVLSIDGGRITAIGTTPVRGLPLLDLGRLLLAPGLVDLHGDAFERQLMPRPGVMIDIDLAFLDTDRQLVANGITTAFHGLSWSWEPGLRSVQTGRAVLLFLEQHRTSLLADHRLHVRFEVFNLHAAPELAELIAARRVDLLAFNDHTPAMAEAAGQPTGNLGNAYRALVPRATFNELALAVHARAERVPATMEALAAAGRTAKVPMLSHDDGSPERRRFFRALGATICEFPTNLQTAQEARGAGEAVVMGAPNLLRGKSHLGWVSAQEAIEGDAANVLASDYYYPALLQAPFQLERRGVLGLAEAWRLVAANPAHAAGLHDRGEIAAGQRADLIAVDDLTGLPPRCIGCWRGGRPIGVAANAPSADPASHEQDLKSRPLPPAAG